MPAMRFARMFGLVAALAAAAPMARAAGGAAACGGKALGTFAAGAATGGRSFRLQDGREVRLAGIETPAGAAATRILDKVVAGRSVLLEPLEPATDRYGRLVAHAFLVQGGSQRWVERELVAQGRARAGAHIGGQACAAALLAAEKAARQARLGLWADPAYAVRRATDAAGLLAQRGRFTLAEGKVLSVRESGGTIYINFGRVWSRNLTVTLLKHNERLFAAAGIDVKKLQGRRLRVRGWVEERGGPRIEATRPEQIEIAD
jgi:Staphylococcal nuclease homologue